MKTQALNRYLDIFSCSSFQGENRLFVKSFENENSRRSYKRYYLSTIEIKDYNVLIDGRNFFDQPVKNYLRAHIVTFKKLSS